MNLDKFFKEVGKHKLLTKEQEVELAQAIENGDRRARDKMIQSNLRLAISIAKQYNRSGCTLEDLIQESTLGLMEAVDRFDWRRGFKFSTYACWWIKQAVRRHVAANSSIIRLPNHANTVLWQAGQLRRDYIESYGHEPQADEIASAMGVSVDMLTSLRACAAPTISLDKPVGSADDGSRKLYEVIPDESDSVIDKMMTEDMKELIRQAFGSLSPREEKVIRLRFGISASADDSNNFPITTAELKKLEERAHANA
jgi:RNA polymerase primary sigma factor